MSDEVFEAVSNVVNNNYDDLYEMNGALYQVRTAYKSHNLRTTSPDLNFTNYRYRYAYLYNYFTCHAYCTKKALLNLSDDNSFTQIADKGFINLCSLGGGPGSDILGTYFFLNEIGVQVEFCGAVLDRYTQWKGEYMAMQKQYDLENIYTLGDMKYIYFDFFKSPVEQTVLNKIHAADLVTIVKFVSAVGSDAEWCESKLTFLLKYVKRGALVLFIDNAWGNYSTLMNDAASYASLTMIDEVIDKRIAVPDSEKCDMEEMKEFYALPLRYFSISASLWRKPKHRPRRRYNYATV